MREQIVSQLLPAALSLLAIGGGWLVRALTRYLARRTYALDTATLRSTSRAVVSELEVEVEDAKNPVRPGLWTPELGASTRLRAIQRVRALCPLAVKTVLASLDNDMDALDSLIGAYVEEALRDLRSKRTTAAVDVLTIPQAEVVKEPEAG